MLVCVGCFTGTNKAQSNTESWCWTVHGFYSLMPFLRPNLSRVVQRGEEKGNTVDGEHGYIREDRKDDKVILDCKSSEKERQVQHMRCSLVHEWGNGINVMYE